MNNTKKNPIVLQSRNPRSSVARHVHGPPSPSYFNKGPRMNRVSKWGINYLEHFNPPPLTSENSENLRKKRQERNKQKQRNRLNLWRNGQKPANNINNAIRKEIMYRINRNNNIRKKSYKINKKTKKKKKPKKKRKKNN